MAPKLTGVDAATIYVIEQHGSKKVRLPLTIFNGDELPANADEGEKERLEKLGAFESQTRAQKVRRQQAKTRAARAEAAAKALADQEEVVEEEPAAEPSGDPKDMKVEEAIAYYEGLPEDERDTALEDEERVTIRRHFDLEE